MAKATKAVYKVSFPEPHTHYIEVSLDLPIQKKKVVDLKMPVWTPGSYLVREFARHVESIAVGANAKVKKVAKNHWQILPAENGTVHITYRVYAFELSVRTSFVDADMAVLNGASVFLRVDSKEKSEYEIQIQPHPTWRKVSTALKTVGDNPFMRKADDFDELVDAPILLGNQAIFTFDVAGVPHIVAMAGQAEYDENRLKDDMKKVCLEASKVIGEHPCKEYTFLIINASGGSGGLEHANSCLLHTSRNVYNHEGHYKNFLGLVAHEYFHLWNVKRIRPIELGPFDYDNENYTNLLWISEGFTSYYDDLICQRAGIIPTDRFLEITASNLNTIENMPGNLVQPLCESSADAWIKYYRSNENSNNSATNYYTKGSIIGLLLDLQIIDATNGKHGLDTLMRILYQKYYKKMGRGFTEDEFQKEVEKLVGQEMNDFFDGYIKGVEPIKYNEYFKRAGYKLINLNEGKAELGLGVGLNTNGGKAIVTSVLKGSPSWKYGVNVNDEVIAVDNYRVGTEINSILNLRDGGDTVSVLISRDGLVRSLQVKLEPYVSFNFRLEKQPNLAPTELRVMKKWLSIK